jgi:putative hemolysin
MRYVLALLYLAQAGSLNPGWGMANPASEFCVKSGGKLEIRRGPAGEYGVCRLPDGREIEEWTYYRQNAGKPR